MSTGVENLTGLTPQIKAVLDAASAILANNPEGLTPDVRRLVESLVHQFQGIDLNVEGLTPEMRQKLLDIHNGGKLDIVESEHIASTKDMSRADWEAARTREAYHSIGGSEAGGIAGFSKYDTPFVIFSRKRGKELGWKVPEKTVGKQAHFGNLLEPVIRREFERECRAQGKRFVVLEYKWMLRHPVHRFMMANIDGLIYDVETDTWGLLEIKTADKMLAKDWFPDKIPNHYLIQTMHYLATLGVNIKWGYVAVLIGGNDPQYRYFERNESLIDTVISWEQDFWHDHIETLVPPEPTGTDQEGELLEEMFPTDPNRVPLLMPPETKALLRRLERAKAIKSRAEKRIERTENKLRLLMQEHRYGELPDSDEIIDIQPGKTTSLDRDAMRIDGVFDKYMRVSHWTKLVIKKAKKPKKKANAV